jgi:hypothetical protein
MDALNIPEEADDNRLPLTFPARKVVPLDRGERLSGPEQAELMRRCRTDGERNTLRVILNLAAGKRRLDAGRARLERDTGRDWATVKRHRAALVALGILEPCGGGYYHQRAVYRIRTPVEADTWLAREAERRAAAGGCPICHEDPPTHTPPRCPLFAKPRQERLAVDE